MNHNGASPKIRSFMVTEYQSGKTQMQVAALTGFSQASVSRILIQENVTTRTRKLLSNSQCETLCRRYQRGLSAREAGEMAGVSEDVALYTLRKLGVERRPPDEATRWRRLDQSAFDNPSPDACYFAGLLMADGSIGSSRHTIGLFVSRRDKEIIREFRKFLRTDIPISIQANNRSHYGGVELCGLQVNSQRLITALARYGVTPRKQTRESIPNWLLDDRDFIRGLIDGDGWVSFNLAKMRKKRRLYPYIGFTGSRTICEQMAEYFSRHGGRKPSLRPNHSIFSVVTTGKYAEKLVSVLYDNACVALRRKASVAKRIIHAAITSS